MSVRDRVPNNIHLMLFDDVMNIMHRVNHRVDVVKVAPIAASKSSVLWKAFRSGKYEVTIE